MSGRNPPLYGTLVLVATQGHQTKQRQNARQAWTTAKFVTLALECMGVVEGNLLVMGGERYIVTNGVEIK